MRYVEIILSFLIGAGLIIFIGWIFSLKTKGIFRLCINTITGGALLLVVSLITKAALPLSPFNALITGLLGIAGVALIIIIVYFL